MIKIITVVGARPQFIKAGSLSREIKKHDDVEEVIVHTGQHYDENMSSVFFEEMGIPKPNYNLNIQSKSHGDMTGKMIIGIEEIIKKENANWIVLYGDTNSTLAGAIAASKLNVKIAHIEAGLRSHNNKMPEEINRILTDRISNLLFCPTEKAYQNLVKEGFDSFDCKYVLSGDIMKDGINYYKEISKEVEGLKKDYVLVTIHRAENTNDITKITEIIDALNELSEKNNILLPIHPRTKKIIQENNLEVKFDIIEPVGYLNMIWLIKNSKLIMTDSGGLQKEAFLLKKPCITLREETEWTELVNNNFNVLVGSSKQKIMNAFKNFNFSENYEMNLYGDNGGKTVSEVIIEQIKLSDFD